MALLTDAEADAIRLGLALGTRGPVLVKWCTRLLAERDERRALERARSRPWPGPLAGPAVARLEKKETLWLVVVGSGEFTPGSLVRGSARRTGPGLR